MKKLDILIISLVILISGSFFGIYFSRNSVDRSDLKILLEFNNEVVYELDIDEDTVYNVEISGSKTTNKLIVVIKDQYYNEIDTKIVPTTFVHSVDYKVYVSMEKTYVKEAICEHGYCLKMILSPSLVTPIICTDGLTIKYKSKLDVSIVTGE